ncbi:MAG: glycogen synthase GlgA [Geminicoccaceae bacterium]
MQVLSVASEVYPLVKTGGLADVAGALPLALARHGIHVRTLLPGYPRVLERLGERAEAAALPDLFGGDARLLAARVGGLDLLVLDAPHLYDRPGGPYAAPGVGDWPDNAQRFAALAWTAAAIGQGLLPDWRPALVHAHDWQAGLTPAYLAYGRTLGPRPATVTTVHNLAFQGQYPASLLAELRLPPESFAVDGVEYYGAIGFLKAGLHFADHVTTVSPTYAQEIQDPASGMGLDGLLRKRGDTLSGIVNGIDDAEWDPATDRHLAERYDAGSLERRAANKRALQERFGLDLRPDAPLFCVVSRLTWQKGMDLLLAALPELVGNGAQLVLLGSGDTPLETGFGGAAVHYAGAVGCIFGYDEPLSHQLQGGADAILVPSRFEPCGLTQLYGLRYGCIPVVARVGGLADTVVDANDAALADGVATGVQFSPVTVGALVAALHRTIRLYRQPEVWRALQARGMSRDVSWSRPAAQYATLYKSLTAGRGD